MGKCKNCGKKLSFWDFDYCKNCISKVAEEIWDLRKDILAIEWDNLNKAVSVGKKEEKEDNNYHLNLIIDNTIKKIRERLKEEGIEYNDLLINYALTYIYESYHLNPEKITLLENIKSENDKNEISNKINNKINQFKKANLWDLIINFSKQYQVGQILEENYEKLKDLLKIKYKIEIEIELLKQIVSKAYEEHKKSKELDGYAFFKSVILNEKPKSRNDYIDALLRNYGEDSLNKDNIKKLRKLLSEKDIDDSEIKSTIFFRKKKLELDYFEKSLFSDIQREELNFNLMSGYEFEQFLSNLFSKMGYNVLRTKLSGDQGADLIIERFGEKTAVQAKCYSDAVSNKAIQEVVAAKNYYRCDKTMVIVTSDFTKSAIDLAKSNKVDLWNRKKLEEMIRRYW